jgi:phage terminase small subunit
MRAREACKENSVYQTTSREGAVIFKAKPEVQISNIARKQLMVSLMELGLTPMSSARVHPLPAAKKKEKGGIESYFSNPDPLKPSA